MTPPVLDTERLRLRPITFADVDALLAIFGDAEVTRYWGAPTLADRDAAEAMVRVIHAGAESGRLLEWAITRPPDEALIGTCALAELHPVHRRADLGFALAPESRGRGFAGEAARVVLDYGFGTLELHRVMADVDPRNTASMRVLERLGFVREGHLREHYRQHGEWQDGVLFGLLADEWRE